MLIDFDFNIDYCLENEYVRLTPLQEIDIEHLSIYSINEPEIWTYSLVSAAGIENMKRYIHQAVDARMRQTDYPFIVFDKVNQQYIGSTRFYDIQLANRTLQLGYTWYGKKYQGSGINKHCKYLMLEFAFEIMKMERVEFRADNENKRSIQAMKNIGASIEGILRSNGFKANGQRRDSIVLSILREEWFEHINKELCLKLPVIILQ